jgi:hypothetical protein
LNSTLLGTTQPYVSLISLFVITRYHLPSTAKIVEASGLGAAEFPFNDIVAAKGKTRYNPEQSKLSSVFGKLGIMKDLRPQRQ